MQYYGCITLNVDRFPEWTILSNVNCFIWGEVIVLDSLHPRSVGYPGDLLQFSKEKLLRSSCRLIRVAFVQCGQTVRNAVLGQ